MIATLRMEGDVLYLDLANAAGAVFYSKALDGRINREQAQRLVEALNFPDAVVVVEELPPVKRGTVLQ